MPYRGKPSLGCGTCRQRKIKCDRREPACFNCEKAGWNCDGYRNITDLLFHDESAQVVRKAKAANRRPHTERVVPDISPTTRCAAPLVLPILDTEQPAEYQHHQDSAQSAIALASFESGLPPDLDDLAVAQFYHDYVFAKNDSEDFIASSGNGCLFAAIKAVGIATVTRFGPGPSTSPQARQSYLNALQLTNAALRSEEYVKLDSTLLAINILGIFESITGFSRPLSSWQEHVAGAGALLELRGRDQFDTALGGLLYLQTATNLIISCIQQRISLPEHLYQIQAIAESHIPDPKDRVWRYHLMNYRFAQLHSTLLPSNYPRSPQDVTRILETALSIEDEIIDMTENVPSDWEYQKVYADGPAVYSSFYYVFQTFFEAQIFSALWCIRLLLIDIMFKALHDHPDPALLGLSPLPLQRLRNAETMVPQLQINIFAAIPQHVGITFVQNDFIPAANATGGSKEPMVSIWMNFISRDSNPWRSQPMSTPPLPFVRMSGGYLVHWPLFVAGAVGVQGSRERTWAQQVLRYVGQDMGHQQALVLANRLDADGGMSFCSLKGLPAGL